MFSVNIPFGHALRHHPEHCIRNMSDTSCTDLSIPSMVQCTADNTFKLEATDGAIYTAEGLIRLVLFLKPNVQIFLGLIFLYSDATSVRFLYRVF